MPGMSLCEICQMPRKHITDPAVCDKTGGHARHPVLRCAHTLSVIAKHAVLASLWIDTEAHRRHASNNTSRHPCRHRRWRQVMSKSRQVRADDPIPDP